MVSTRLGVLWGLCTAALCAAIVLPVPASPVVHSQHAVATPPIGVQAALGSRLAPLKLDRKRPIPIKRHPKAKPKSKSNLGKAAQAASPPPGVIVAVIDGGVDITHPALAGHLWVNLHEIPGNGVDDDNDGVVDDVNGANLVTDDANLQDETGHGTHVSGIILQADPTARIMVLKAGSGHFIDIAAAAGAIHYAVDHGARIINLSWAFESGAGFLADALEYARQHDVLVVAAAGNFSFDNDLIPTYPASYSSDALVAVAATCDGRTLAPFSDFGKLSVSIAAPGCSVRSSVPGGGYALMSGTSMAAPAVAGAAALLLERYPKLTAVQLKEALLGGAQVEPALMDSVQSGATLSVDGSLAAAGSPDRTAPAAFASLAPSRTFVTERDPSYYYQDVTFSWTASSDPSLAGYRVVVDGLPVAAVGSSVTSATVKIAPGTHTWFAVAFDRSGNETSGAS
jgi:subtilisin family serine protease